MKIAAISIADYAEAVEGMPYDAERLFFRMLIKMYSRERGLPDDDKDNARMFGYDLRRYKRLKAVLLAFPCGLYVVDKEIRNQRFDVELVGIRARKKALKVAGSIGGKTSTKGGSRAEVGSKSDRSTPLSGPRKPAKSTTCGNLSPSPSPKRRKAAPKSRDWGTLPEALRRQAAAQRNPSSETDSNQHNPTGRTLTKQVLQ